MLNPHVLPLSKTFLIGGKSTVRYRGLNFIARHLRALPYSAARSPRVVHGFDSFRGLPTEPGISIFTCVNVLRSARSLKLRFFLGSEWLETCRNAGATLRRGCPAEPEAWRDGSEIPGALSFGRSLGMG